MQDWLSLPWLSMLIFIGSLLVLEQLALKVFELDRFPAWKSS
jgi:hypothetical protein